MSTAGAPLLSLVIPAFNEAARLPQSLRKLVEFSSRFPRPFEVLVVVEKSTDGTADLARQETANQPNFKIINNEVQRGKGYAVVDLPVRLKHAPGSKVQVVRDSVLMLLDIIRVRRLVDQALKKNPAPCRPVAEEFSKSEGPGN